MEQITIRKKCKNGSTIELNIKMIGNGKNKWWKGYEYYTFDNWEEAYKQAIKLKKTNKIKWYIEKKYDSDLLFPAYKYILYTNKIICEGIKHE